MDPQFLANLSRMGQVKVPEASVQVVSAQKDELTAAGARAAHPARPESDLHYAHAHAAPRDCVRADAQRAPRRVQVAAARAGR